MRILSLALCMAWVWVQPAHAQTIAITDDVRALTQRAMERVVARVDERLVADSILRIAYIETFERHIIRWVFTFYRPEDRWVVNGVTWDDDIDALF